MSFLTLLYWTVRSLFPFKLEKYLLPQVEISMSLWTISSKEEIVVSDLCHGKKTKDDLWYQALSTELCALVDYVCSKPVYIKE